MWSHDSGFAEDSWRWARPARPRATLRALAGLAASLSMAAGLLACDRGAVVREGPTVAPPHVAGAASVTGPAAGRPAAPLRAGMTVPDIELPTLDGRTLALSDFRGGPVLVNFWASWCPPCREEFPVLAAARERHRAAGFEVVGISHNDGQTYALRYVAEVGASWPMLVDENDEAWRAFGAVGLPSSYLIDADGVLQRIHFGPLDEAQLEDHLAAVGMAARTSGRGEPSRGPG